MIILLTTKALHQTQNRKGVSLNSNKPCTHIFLNINERGWVDSTKTIVELSVYQNSILVTFSSGKSYHFSFGNILILDDCIEFEIKDFDSVFETVNGKLYQSEMGYYLYDKKRGIRKISKEVISRCINKQQLRENLFPYYRLLAELFDEKNCGDFLLSQYSKIKSSWLKNHNVLYDILHNRIVKTNFGTVLFPFSYNGSQIKAVNEALSNNISVIQGPPGTGKTQTILNIIINIITQKKTVAVLSNNNLAVINIQEKLEKEGYGFLCATLGNTENREAFFTKETRIPVLPETEDNEDISLLIEQQKRLIENEELLCKLIKERDSFEKEYQRAISDTSLPTLTINKNVDKKEILALAVHLEDKRKKRFTLFDKIRYFLKYGIPFHSMKITPPEFTERLRKSYIIRKMEDQNLAIEELLSLIQEEKNEHYTERVIKSSVNQLNRNINKRYQNRKFPDFNKDNFKEKFSDFIYRFPVILSSTYSLPTTVPNHFLFDYIIIDEASQSTITTVIPSLMRAKNIVVIGDDKQLPPVIVEGILEREKGLAEKYLIPQEYRDDGKSFLSFIQATVSKVPVTLLREHYRCPSQIIGFSNEKFYGNQLILKNVNNNKNQLKAIKTVPGNHARKNSTGTGLYNQREIDEVIRIVKELPKDKTIGVITPYKKQAELLKASLPKCVDVGTIHTFQGREKQIIILSTVANNINDFKTESEVKKAFVNNEQMINVAITRATERFILVTSSQIAQSNNNVLSDLVKYIQYETKEGIETSPIVSVFDLLYADYAEYRQSIYPDSILITEDIFVKLLKDVLKEEKYQSLSFSLHVPIKSIIQIRKEHYNKDEYEYLSHPWTHFDFVIFNKFDKKPVLAIEVDGVSYHEQNKKQAYHDTIKDKCVKDVSLPFLRLKTNQSQEREVLVNALESALGL